MLIGLIFVLAGVMIAMYPPLLSLIVAVLLIMMGLSFFYMGYAYKKMSRRSEDPFTNFFFRF
ncbi:MAG: hypothetical protein PHH75_08425 [Candidatus Omnitrophica bacterium]|nr:hypothetical protein [Candidatus Omnitrophota bacterium]MDD5575183.1 hypothetical protein [Candidatus Omnitrophota bacterium]